MADDKLAQDGDRLLVQQIRDGETSAWQQLIDRYEGRLIAFVNRRLNDRAISEDVVQETFLGFLISLPNYKTETPVESYLFSIASHKLTDVLRKQHRRPAIPTPFSGSSGGGEFAGKGRRASSLVRSQERKTGEEDVVARALLRLIEGWLAKEPAELERLKCIELLFVLGWSNKDVAKRLNISEQAVANHKHFVVSRLKDAGLTMPDSDLPREEF